MLFSGTCPRNSSSPVSQRSVKVISKGRQLRIGSLRSASTVSWEMFQSCSPTTRILSSCSGSARTAWNAFSAVTMVITAQIRASSQGQFRVIFMLSPLPPANRLVARKYLLSMYRVA